MLTSANAPAAVVGELASCGESVLALTAPMRSCAPAWPARACRLADYAELERPPGLAADFDHVVLVDPPPSADLERLASRSRAPGGYLHRVWGEAEWRLALKRARRAAGAAADPDRGLPRPARSGRGCSGEDLREALLGSGRHPRSAETAARCFRVLAELGLVRGTPDGGDGEVGVVSSEGTDLERSAAFRAYGARHEEARQYLEAHRHP